MAELAKYQPTGRVFADLPQLDFANVRESFKRSQTIGASLDRLSQFAAKAGEKYAEEEAQKYAVENPITIDDIRKAQESGVSAEELIKASKGGTVWEDTLRKYQGEQLRTQLEVQGNAAMTNILEMVNAGQLTDPNEIKQKFESAIAGYEKPLIDINPDSAIAFKKSMGVTASTFYKSAVEKITKDYLITEQVNSQLNVDNQLKIAKEVLKIETDPTKIEEIKKLLFKRVFEQGKNGGVAFGQNQAKEFLKSFDDLQLGNFESIALSKEYIAQSVSGLPDIDATMKKMANGDFGTYSASWNTLDQEKKDKVIQSVYTRLTQGYAANKATQSAMKEQKEKENINTILDLRTPGKVTGANRLSTLRTLAADNVISPEQYSDLLEEKPKALSPYQKYLKDYAAYEIRSGNIKNLSELQDKYGKKLPIDAIGDLLKPLVDEDEKAVDKFKSKYSGADYDPYHLQPTVQKKWLIITDKTDELWAKTKPDGTKEYPSKLAASKAAAQEIDKSKETVANIKNQKTLYQQFKAFGIDVDSGGVIEALDANINKSKSKAERERLNTFKSDYKRYLEYKQKNNNKGYNELPDETKLQSGGE